MPRGVPKNKSREVLITYRNKDAIPPFVNVTDLKKGLKVVITKEGGGLCTYTWTKPKKGRAKNVLQYEVEAHREDLVIFNENVVEVAPAAPVPATEAAEATPKKKRGRPKKVKAEVSEETEDKPAKKKRGRPKKVKAEVSEDAPKKRRKKKKGSKKAKAAKEEAPKKRRKKKKSKKVKFNTKGRRRVNYALDDDDE